MNNRNVATPQTSLQKTNGYFAAFPTNNVGTSLFARGSSSTSTTENSISSSSFLRQISAGPVESINSTYLRPVSGGPAAETSNILFGSALLNRPNTGSYFNPFSESGIFETRADLSVQQPTPPQSRLRTSLSNSTNSGLEIRRPFAAGSVSVSATPRSSTNRTLVESVDLQTVVAIVEGRGQARGEIGIACINLRTSNLILCQFSDAQTYHRVIAKMNIFRPHQILMPTTCCERTGTATQMYNQIKTELSNVEIVPILRKAFSEGKGLQRVKQLVVAKFNPVVQVVTQKYYCLAAAAALLKYVELVQSIIFSPKSMKIEFQGSENTCMIDSKTALHLELLQNNHRAASLHSVLGILSSCRTPGGSRTLRMNILQPPCDLKLIQQRLDCVEELSESREVLCGLQDVLGRIPMDIEHVISTLIQIPKTDSARITEQRINFIIALKHTLELLPVFIDTLENTQHDFFQTIRSEFREPIFDTILEKIKHVLNEEVQVKKGMVNMRRQRYFAVKAEVNPILDIARKAYCEIVEDIQKYVSKLSNDLDLVFRLGESIKNGYYIQLILPGRGEQVPKLPNTFLQVSKHRNVIHFTTESLLSFDHRCQEVGKEIENISAIVVSELITQIRDVISSLYTVSEGISQLDVIFALTSYSLTTTRCVRPMFSKIATAITNGRHPVLDMVKIDPSVPNNTFLTEDTNFALITGPNMSGKTTYLKQVATLQILAQLGCFVPAEAATFRISSTIFSRLGTGDSLEDNASSFAVEMTEMNYIISNINDNSLVIIDELGRGTSVEEGAAISWAFAEELLKTKSFILFATHFLFLSKLEAMYANALNYTMETQEWTKKADDINILEADDPLENCKLKYTHVLKRGVTEVEHYGLKLASATSYPPQVVQNAFAIANKIIQSRKKPDDTEIADEEENQKKKGIYLLGVQLKLLAENSDNVPKEELRDYLKTLQLEFKTKFGLSTNSTPANSQKSMTSHGPPSTNSSHVGEYESESVISESSIGSNQTGQTAEGFVSGEPRSMGESEAEVGSDIAIV